MCSANVTEFINFYIFSDLLLRDCGPIAGFKKMELTASLLQGILGPHGDDTCRQEASFKQMEKSTFPKDFWIMCRFRPSLTKSRILLLASQTSWKLMLSKFFAIHRLWFIFRWSQNAYMGAVNSPNNPQKLCNDKNIRPVLSVQLYRKG